MRIRPKIAVTFAAALAASTSAGAATLNLTVTADNAFSVYLSTNNSVLGTLVGSNLYGPAGQWETSFSYTPALTNPIEYLQVVGTNYTSANSLWNTPGTTNGSPSNPDAFLGQLSITGGGYTFAANGTTSLNTNATLGQWLGIDVGNNTSWTLPTNPVQSFGNNGGNNIWGNALGGPVPGISTSADWIWSLPDNGGYADLSTEIISSNTPLPAALPLFASGLGALGLLGWRRKRKAQAA